MSKVRVFVVTKPDSCGDSEFLTYDCLLSPNLIHAYGDSECGFIIITYMSYDRQACGLEAHCFCVDFHNGISVTGLLSKQLQTAEHISSQEKSIKAEVDCNDQYAIKFCQKWDEVSCLRKLSPHIYCDICAMWRHLVISRLA